MQPPPIGRALCNRSPRCSSIPSARIFSDTVLQMALANVVAEPLAGFVHQIEDVVEALGAAVVGVRNFGLRRVRGEVEKGTDHGAPPAEGRDHMIVFLVHGEDVVEDLAILGFDAAGTLGAEIEAAQPRATLRPLVGGLTDVPGAGPGGVHEDLALQTFAAQDVLEDALSKG